MCRSTCRLSILVAMQFCPNYRITMTAHIAYPHCPSSRSRAPEPAENRVCLVKQVKSEHLYLLLLLLWYHAVCHRGREFERETFRVTVGFIYEYLRIYLWIYLKSVLVYKLRKKRKEVKQTQGIQIASGLALVLISVNICTFVLVKQVHVGTWTSGLSLGSGLARVFRMAKKNNFTTQ